MKRNIKLDGATLYNMNKQLIKQHKEKPLTKEQLKQKEINLVQFINSNTNSKYYMLLCNELRDYTIFQCNDIDKTVQTLFSCFNNRNVKILDIERQDTGFEIWIETNKNSNLNIFDLDETIYCYHFFPCDQCIAIC